MSMNYHVLTSFFERYSVFANFSGYRSLHATNVLPTNWVYAFPALVCYDWLIKLDEEIHSVWHFRGAYKFNVAALLYGLNRYPMMINQLLGCLALFPMSDTVSILFYLYSTPFHR